jgi:ANTAR domain
MNRREPAERLASDTVNDQDGNDFDRAVDEAVDLAVSEFTAHRSIIEQAKGMVMVAYSIPADRAFDVLKWRSQQTNTKIRTLCELIVKRAVDEISIAEDSRSKFDEILLSAPDHQI